MLVPQIPTGKPRAHGGLCRPSPLSPETGLLQPLGCLGWQLGRLYSLGLCLGPEGPSRYGLGSTVESGKGFFGKEDPEVWFRPMDSVKRSFYGRRGHSQVTMNKVTGEEAEGVPTR